MCSKDFASTFCKIKVFQDFYQRKQQKSFSQPSFFLLFASRGAITRRSVKPPPRKKRRPTLLLLYIYTLYISSNLMRGTQRGECTRYRHKEVALGASRESSDALILVAMGHGSELALWLMFSEWLTCLNPCCNGKCTRRAKSFYIVNQYVKELFYGKFTIIYRDYVPYPHKVSDNI